MLCVLVCCVKSRNEMRTRKSAFITDLQSFAAMFSNNKPLSLPCCLLSSDTSAAECSLQL